MVGTGRMVRTFAENQAGPTPALFEIQRKEVHVKPSRPFDSRLEDDTWTRYKDVMKQLMRIWQRTQTLDDDDRPQYRLTGRQRELWDAFEEAVEKSVDANGETSYTNEEIDRMYLDMVIGFFNHQFKQSHYDNIIISSLAVMGIRDDGGWVDAVDYMPVYSAVIKMARMLVLHQSYLEREEKVVHMMEKWTMSETEARDEADVQRFMTRITDKIDAEPTPMDWNVRHAYAFQHNRRGQYRLGWRPSQAPAHRIHHGAVIRDVAYWHN